MKTLTVFLKLYYFLFAFMKGMIRLKITETIKILLLKNGSTNTELAEKLGMTPQNLSYRFKRDDFKVSELEKIAEFFGMELIVKFKEKDN